MTTPKRIQLRRTKGWRKPEGAIVVARPSRWGNWYRVVRFNGEWNVTLNGQSLQRFDKKAPAIGQAVRWFRQDCEEVLHAETDGKFFDQLEALRGHDLACWCALEDMCHADVLLELANGPTS